MYVSLCVCARACVWLNVSVHVYFSVLIWLCSQMTVPLYNMTLKCAKCGVISSADVSTTATSNAMLVPLIIYQLFDALPSVLFSFLPAYFLPHPSFFFSVFLPHSFPSPCYCSLAVMSKWSAKTELLCCRNAKSCRCNRSSSWSPAVCLCECASVFDQTVPC